MSLISVRMIILLFCMGMCTNVDAQLSAKDAISMIKDDGLVVRINSYNPKLDTLSRLIENGDISNETREELINQKMVLLEDYRVEVKTIMHLFDSLYHFSKVHYVPDSLFSEFVKGKREEIFLDSTLQLVSSQEISDRFVFVYTPYSSLHGKLYIRHSGFIPELSEYKRILPPMKTDVGKASFHIGKIFKVLSPTVKWIDLTKESLTESVKRLAKHFKDLDRRYN